MSPMPTKIQRGVDLAIDRFVERVNQSVREELNVEAVPDLLRVGHPSAVVFEQVSWQVVDASAPCVWRSTSSGLARPRHSRGRRTPMASPRR